jgi:small-conductance mechanosensitive channel
MRRVVRVDLQEKRQLDLARQVAKVKAQARPWRAIIALVLAVAAAIVSFTADSITPNQVLEQVIAIGGALAFCLLAVVAVIGFARKSRDVMQPVTGRAHAAVVRYTIVLVGSIAVLFITLGLLDVPIDQLLVGGAVTSIILGIAAQQSLGNVFSGLVLLLSHPFGVGDAVSFRSGAFSGEVEGIVTEIGITYVRIETAEGNIRLPNSQVLASAVGPAHQDEPAGQVPAQADQAGQVPAQADQAGQVPAQADQAGQVPAQADQARQAPTQAASGSAPAGPSAG